MPRFAANLSTLFTERSFLERFELAATCGFEHVEFQFPYEHPTRDLRAALDAAGVRPVLFNLPAGVWSAGDRGIAGDPDRTQEFRDGVDQALEYALALDCPRLNCLAGIRLDGFGASEQWDVLVANVRHAGRRLAEHGRSLVIEPLNNKDVPGFLLGTTADAVRLLDDVADPNARLQFDIYHAQRAEGDVTALLRTLMHRIGHVQIADNPGRHQPGTGELNFPFIFAELDRLGYQGFVGLEYIPEPDTMSSFAWRETLARTTGA